LEAAFRPQLDEAMEFVFNVIKASVARQRNANYQQIRVSEKKSQKKEIDHILLAGGMSRIPCVSKELRRQLGKDPVVDMGLVDPEKSVVSGLTFEDAVTGLNVHRPGFGFVAEYLNAQGENIGEQVLYEAFSPLYKKYEPFIQLTDLGVRTVLEPPAGAQSVKMVCRGISGRKVPLRLGDKTESGIELPLSMHRRYRTQQFFKLYVDGRIILSAKRHAHFWFPRWPILRDGLAAELQVKSQKPRRPWYNPEIDVAVASRHRR
jgi:hypothetical protein